MLRGQSNQAASTIVARWATMALCTLLLTTGTAFGQGSTTATIRGNVQDSSGGVAAGRDRHAHQHRARKPCRRPSATIADSTCSAACSRAPTISRSSSPGSSPTSGKASALSPSDKRGIDVRLDVGQQTETDHRHRAAGSHSDGNRRARRRAEREADRQPVGHRPQRARTAAHPARRRRPTSTRASRSASAAARNNTQGYTVNGIRSSSNTVVARRLVAHRHRQQQRRHRHPEQRHGSGSEGAELELRGRVRHRRHERQRRHQVRQLEVPRRGLRLLARFSKFAANDRSNSIAGTPKPKSKYQYPGGNIGGPITFGDNYTKNRDKLFFFAALRRAAAAGRLGLALLAHLHPGDAQRRLQRAAREPRLEPEQHRAAADSAGIPERRAARAEQRHAAVHHADREVPRQPLSAAELQRPEQSLQLRLQPPRADEPDRLQVAVRLEHQQQHEGLRPRRARERDGREPARRVVGPVGRRAAVAEHRHEHRPLVRRQRRVGAEPDDDERGAGQLQPPDARQPLQGSERDHAGRRRHHVQRHLPRRDRPARTCRPTCCTGGAAAARSATCGRRRTTSTRTTTRCSSATS